MKPTWQERLNDMSDESLREALRKRKAYIKAQEKLVIKLESIETEYRCVEQTVTDDDTNEILSEGIILQYKGWHDDEWNDVTDLTELKAWQYNKLVDLLHKHYPDYPIEHLEGRFV